VPFVARDTPALLYAVVHTMPIRPSLIAPVTAHEEACLAIALAKHKNERFASAAELAAAFAAAWRSELDEGLLRHARTLMRHRPWAEPNEP
jgi:hypothetical protein